MTAQPRTILCAAENSVEYQMGIRAAHLGIKGKAVPFKPGSVAAMRFVYGMSDCLAEMRRVKKAEASNA
jgi:hypothetical protein